GREAELRARGADGRRARVRGLQPAVRARALETGRVVERRQRDEAGRLARAGAVGVADLAVLPDRDVGRPGRDLEQRVGAAGRAALDVVAVLGDQLAGAVGGEVAGTRVLG